MRECPVQSDAPSLFPGNLFGFDCRNRVVPVENKRRVMRLGIGYLILCRNPCCLHSDGFEERVGASA